MKLLRIFLSLTLIAASLTPVDAQSLDSELVATQQRSDGSSEMYLKNQILVKYRGENRINSSSARLQRTFGIRVVRTLAPLRVQVLRVPEGQDVDSFIAQVEAHPDVEYAERNLIFKASFTPDDPQFASQDYMQASLLNMPQTWDIERGETSIVIAVVDTGVALTHPDLANTLWVNPNPSGTSGTNGTAVLIDWNGDGDCLDTDPSAGAEQCESSDPTDDNTGTFHGTAAAGIISAQANNTINIAGIAHNCRIMAVKALNSSGFGTSDGIAAGILFASANGASIINLSLGATSESSTITSAVNTALGNNVVVVAAAGNTSVGQSSCDVNFPAAQDRVIAVGATTSTDGQASFSCSGPELDVMAPGVSVLTLTSPTGTQSISGTSFSAPMVSALAALLRSLNANMSVDDVTRFINFNALDLGNIGFDSTFGFGRILPLQTLNSAVGGTLPLTNPIDTGKAFAYPNPFNPTTQSNVTISVPTSLGSSGLELQIFTLAGEEIIKLNGTNQWNGKNESGEFVGSGLYVYFLKTNSGDTTGKITILK